MESGVLSAMMALEWLRQMFLVGPLGFRGMPALILKTDILIILKLTFLSRDDLIWEGENHRYILFNRDSTTFLIENISAEKICHRCRLGILRGVFWHLKRSVFCFDTKPLRFVVWLIEWLIDRLFDWCWITTNFLVKMSTKFGRTSCRDRKNRKSVMHKSTCSTIKTPLCSKNIGAVYRPKLCSLWSEMVTSCDVKQQTYNPSC